MNRLYALIWAIVFGVAGNYFTLAENSILIFIGYASWFMFGLSVVTLFKTFGR